MSFLFALSYVRLACSLCHLEEFFGMRCLLDLCLDRKLTRIHLVTLRICQIGKIVLWWNYEVDWKIVHKHSDSHNDELQITIIWSNFLLLAPKNSHSIRFKRYLMDPFRSLIKHIKENFGIREANESIVFLL